MAEEAYRLDALQAERAAWYPVAHRWVSSWASEELSVVFEYRGSDVQPASMGSPAAAAAAQDAGSFAPTETPANDTMGEPQPVQEASAEAGLASAAEGPTPQPRDESGSRDASAEVGRAAESVDPDPAWEMDDSAAMEAGAAADLTSQTDPDTGSAPETQDLQARASGALGVLPSPGAPASARPSSRPAVRAHARAVVQAIDLHAAGEPLRLIRSGFPPVPSLPILERRRWLQQNADYARRVLMWEPRGHRDMYGAILLPPYREEADIAVLFMHNEGYSTMCGHGIIAITTGLIEEGLYPAAPPQTVIHFETPAGLVSAVATVTRTSDGRNEVSSVRFRNVPAYLHEAAVRVAPESMALHGRAAGDQSLSVDLAFGGAYYGIVDAADLGLRVVPEQTAALARAGEAITEVLRRDHSPTHPTEGDLGFVYGTIIVDRQPATSPDGRSAGADMRNVTIFADAQVDRSPCGSGTSALLAQMRAAGRLGVGGEIVNAGITGEAFRARIEEDTFIGERPAVITSVEGSAWVTGYHTFVVDDRDPLGNGFLLR